MAEYNYATKEINVKIVYYGPGLCGKTTNLQYIHSSVDKENRGEMIALATKTDRTLFFDFLPIHAGNIHGFKTRFLLYTVPGQVYYDSTRKVVLRGADGVVFVADSSPDRMEANKESLRNLEVNLRSHKMDLNTMPWVLQFNKRDLANALPIETMLQELNTSNVPAFKGCAINGDGVFEILHKLLGLTMKHLNQKMIDAGRGALLSWGKKDTEPIDFESMNWFSDLSNPPELDPTMEIGTNDTETTEQPPKTEAPISVTIDDDNEPLPLESSQDIILDLPTQVNLDLPDNWEPPQQESVSIETPPEKEPVETNDDAGANEQKSDKVLRVKKTIGLPLPLRTKDIPRQIQLNLVLNIKLIPDKPKNT